MNSRNKLEKLSSESNLELKPVIGRKINISIVGLHQNYPKDGIIDQLTTQNEFLSQFSKANDINEHLSIHAVKSTKANDKVFQIFASVSSALRKGFQKHMDKITVGLSICKIYDRMFIKYRNKAWVTTIKNVKN